MPLGESTAKRGANEGGDAEAHRRVDLNEAAPFRRRLLEAAQELCRQGREAQMPVLPECLGVPKK